ncbi:MAG: T9SS type A sorting domain-containing protein [Flavobacteriales bacterium]|nr:T9SS type A sorting domain-containing protein [Flavobacteriales bacterium]
MKKIYTLLCASVLSVAGFSQCTPNEIFVAIGLPGVFPLPTDPLPNGSMTIPYQGSGLTVSFLTSDQGVDPSTLPLPLPVPVPPGNTIKITGMAVTSVDGLPNGMTAACNNATCSWSFPEQGCFLISGTPTESGDFTVVFNTSFTGEVESLLGTFPFSNTPAAPVQYNLRINEDASIAEFGLAGLALYPNPASEVFFVSYPSAENEKASIQIIDFNGKTVFSENIAAQNQGGVASVDVSALAAGMYRVVFSSGSVQAASKLVVRK